MADIVNALFEAVETDNFQRVKCFVHTKGVNLNLFNACCKTLLHIAAEKGYVEVAKELLEAGADINMRTIDGRTSLFLAAEHGKDKIVNILLEKPNIDVNLHHNGRTPLLVACEKGYTSVVKLLLADYRCMHYINIDHNGSKPLHIAAKYGYEDIISALLEKKPSVNSIDSDGCTPLWIALDNNQEKSVQALLKDFRVNVNFRFKDRTPLGYAVQEGSSTISKLLIERDADINIIDNDGLTLLHHAICKGLLDVVDHLLNRGASVHSKTKRGNTPLHIASMYGELEIAKLLFDKGADVHINCENSYKATPVQLAVKGSHLEMAKFLIKKGADINATDPHTHYTINKGGTLLHWAAREYDQKFQDKMIRFLVENGADVNAAAYDGRTPLCLLVKHHGTLDIMRYLIEKGANLNKGDHRRGSPLLWAFYVDSEGLRPEVANFLIEMGADVNQPLGYFGNSDDPLKTPLHVAKNISTIELLVEKGADINATDKWGNTPLHFAHSLHRAKYLVLKGANVNAINKEGNTPLHCVLNVYCAKFLIKMGADVDAKNSKGYTPLHFAVNTSIAKILIRNGADFRARAENGKTVLHTVAEADVLFNSKYKGLPDLVNFFIQGGIDVNGVDGGGNTPLHICCKTNNMIVASSLLENGADRNAINNCNLRPIECGRGMSSSMLKSVEKLFSAIEENESTEEIRRLICSIQTINVVKDDSKFTPLHCAVQLNRKKIVKFILEANWPIRIHETFKKRNKFIDGTLKKVKVNALCKDNWTPLHYASRGGDFTIVSWLLKSGAAHNAKTYDGYLPSELAENCAVKQLLTMVNELFEAVKVGNLEQVVEYISKEESIINAVESDGRNLLHYSIENGHRDVVMFLLESGIDVTQSASDGSTVLHLAVSKKDEELVNAILKRANDMSRLNSFINAEKLDGITALHIAAKSGSSVITKTLLKNGAAFDIQNKNNLKPVDFSANEAITCFFILVEEVFKFAEEKGEEIPERLETMNAEDFYILSKVRNSYGHTLADIIDLNESGSVVKKLFDLQASKEKQLFLQNRCLNSQNMNCVEESSEDIDIGSGLLFD
ncbi:unnamed protein product [Bemisia tabaci]|uniref:Uncharacterized protein n=1 Tax=Bemisia tabaci TaxID=7038 RepID=A0A9P0F9W4_BEMTA|nr:unnamed protein product [Bemisia tabaci]